MLAGDAVTQTARARREDEIDADFIVAVGIVSNFDILM